MTVKITGAKELEKALRQNATMSDVKRVVQHNGARLQNSMTRKAEFAKGYQTGTTKRSIRLQRAPDGLSAIVGPETEYAPYLEYGTRFMEAQSFVRPALDEVQPKFDADIKKLMR